MKKISLVLSCVALVLFSFRSYSQISEAFAAGRIYLDAAGPPPADCSGPFVYNVTLTFFADLAATTLPATKDVSFYRSSVVGSPITTVTLNATGPAFKAENRCIFGGIESAGRYYTGQITFPSAENDWVVFYGDDKDQGSFAYTPSSANLNGQQQFYFDTELDNSCEMLQIPGNGTRFNTGRNQNARLINDEPLETFCTDRPYEFTLFAQDPDGDSLNFKIVPVENNRNTSVQYYTENNPPFASFRPFPLKPGTGLELDPVTGILKFTAQLEPGAADFTAIVGIEVVEYRDISKIVSLPAGDEFDDEVTVAVCTTNHVVRIVIGPSCNPNIPEFVGVGGNKFTNTAEIIAQGGTTTKRDSWDYWEYDCGSTTLDFRLVDQADVNQNKSEPMLYESLITSDLIAGGFDFRLTRALEDRDPYPFDSIHPFDFNPLSPIYNADGLNVNREFDALRFVMENDLGPGLYYLITKLGGDGTTLENRCASIIPEGDTIAGIYVNTDLEYLFPNNDKLIEYCYPEDNPYALDFLDGSALNVGAAGLSNSYSSWRTNDRVEYVEFQYPYPSNATKTRIERDDFDDYPGTLAQRFFDIRVDTATNPDGVTIGGTGTWGAWIGTRYPYYNLAGVEFVPTCDSEVSQFNLKAIENPTYTIDDYDLCPQEPWPVVDLEYLRSLVPERAVNFAWELATSIKFPESEESGEVADTTWTPVGGENDATLEVAGFATQIGKKSVIRALVTFESGCVVEEVFTVIRQRVGADIGESDVICEGEQYRFGSRVDYEIPSQMSYRWLLDGVPIPGETEDSTEYTVTGTYELEVTKTTAGSQCKDTAIVYTVINPLLEKPFIVCESVSFVDGQVEQIFRTQPLANADTFEVREVYVDSTRSNWIEINGDDGFTHTVFGAQIGLEIRGVNLRVEDDAICKYSDVAIADPCEIIVKSTNVFTPNGDGINDLLRFDLIEVYPGSKLQIYNRWGELVYESNSYQNDWTGVDNKAGVYYYILEINDPEMTNPELFKGNFTLIR